MNPAEYALRLVKFRARSEQELREKLKRREYTSEEIEKVISSFKRSKLLDDRLFARVWVDSRLKRSYGLARIRRELKEKGVDAGLVEESLERYGADYDEKEAIVRIVEKKLARMKGLDIDKVRSRLFGFLARRGYPKGLILEVLFKFCKPAEKDGREI